MESKNSCKTYFAIVGDFEPEAITGILGLSPNKSWGKNDLRKDGKPYGFANWEYGLCQEYDSYVEKQMEKTIEDLITKINELNKIRDSYDVQFYLNVVPHTYVNDIAPCLAPSLKVIDFCHDTRTKIDIDLYIYSSNETDSCE